MKTLFSSAYFGSIEYYAAWVQAENPVIDIHENYQKQTYRSRAYIGGANGALALNVPVRHIGRGGVEHQNMVNATTSVEFRWAKEHFRSLETAYRTSPYFEFYEDAVKTLYFSDDVERLLDVNIKAHKIVCHLLGIDENFSTTEEYISTPNDAVDMRNAFLPKKSTETNFEPYTQVFEVKNGFLPNLSILDLIFCIGGREALEYLKNVKLAL
ncbi:MAG: WbqC family protein [Flavobacteriales bacterium]|nr:WbqC family protein [Flavobacteriales bacterium]